MKQFMKPALSHLLLAVALLAATMAIAGCGGGNVEEEPTAPVSQMQPGTANDNGVTSGAAPRAVEQDAPMAAKSDDAAAP